MAKPKARVNIVGVEDIKTAQVRRRDGAACPLCEEVPEDVRSHLETAHRPPDGCRHCKGGVLKLDYDLVLYPQPTHTGGYFYHEAACGRYT
jgi:hypothetical protein